MNRRETISTDAAVLRRDRQRLDKRAACKRAYRARLEAGGASLKGVPIKDLNALIAVLINLRWLPEARSEDRNAIAAAVGALLDDLAGSRSR